MKLFIAKLSIAKLSIAKSARATVFNRLDLPDKLLKKKPLMSAVLLCAAGLFSQYAAALTPFNATYQFSYGGRVMGDASRVLSKNGNVWQYQFISKIPMLGNANETSRFILNNGQIQSISFVRQTKILVHRDSMSLNFDAQKGQIATRRGEQSRLLKWQVGVLDDLNAELQVREDLQHQGLKPTYLIADAKNVAPRQFINEGKENIKIATGQIFEAIKVRLKHDDPQRNTIFWLAPRLNYLPVKVTHQDDGNTYGLLLKGVA